MMQQWQRCPPGTYSKQGTINEAYYSCQPCPEGSWCPNKEDDAVAINNGYYSPFGMHQHFPVPAGYKGSSTQPLRPCKPGEYSADFADTCTPCVAGEVCTFTSNEPMACNEGMYSENGDFSCIPCPHDEYFDEVSKTCLPMPSGSGSIHPMYAPELCKARYYSDATTISSTGDAGDCTLCNPGSICEGGSTSSTPATCPAGYWCNAHDTEVSLYTKHPCPPGYKASGTTDSTSMAQACSICDSGNFCYGADNPQTTCPGGFFCPTGTKSPTQFPCPAGTYSGDGATSCTACTDGHYCPQGTKTPYACPPGY